MEEYGGKNDAGVMTAMDFMNDFATEEFLTKNIRVRPQSGAAAKDLGPDTEQKSEAANANKSLFGIEGGDEEEKFTKMMALEIVDQRRHIKVAKEEHLKKKQLEEERAKAKKGKENA